MPSRKDLRLRGFDYSTPRVYFVTACARRRGAVFGVVEVNRGTPIVVLNAVGREASAAIFALPAHGCTVVVKSIVMPDHIHLVVGLADGGSTLGAVVGGFKASVARRLRVSGLWQRGYYDRVVRDERELESICAYIEANPARWLASHSHTQ